GMFLNDGNWHFAAGVSDGTSDYLYLDGLLVKSNTAVGAVVGSLQDVILGGDPQYLGPAANGGGRCFDGNIAQVAFFTNALSVAAPVRQFRSDQPGPASRGAQVQSQMLVTHQWHHLVGHEQHPAHPENHGGRGHRNRLGRTTGPGPIRNLP